MAPPPFVIADPSALLRLLAIVLFRIVKEPSTKRMAPPFPAVTQS